MEPLWYFAYGSNLDPDTFLGRRRMRPLESRVTRLDGFGLCFDLPVGVGERAVATVRRQPDACVWGVGYALTPVQFDRLDQTEGVPRGAYTREPVTLCCADGTSVAAFTYCSEHRLGGRRPSRRYLGLLIRGARYHRLPEEYVTFLRGIPTAPDERDRQLELFGSEADGHLIGEDIYFGGQPMSKVSRL